MTKISHFENEPEHLSSLQTLDKSCLWLVNEVMWIYIVIFLPNQDVSTQNVIDK